MLLIVLMFAFLQFKPVPRRAGGLAGEPGGRAAGGGLRLSVRDRERAHCRHCGLERQPGQRYDDRHADGNCGDLPGQRGWTAPAFGALAITIGGMVCIAASNAGDTSQDLKTGYLIGATPWKQQLAVMIGVVVSTLAIAPR